MHSELHGILASVKASLSQKRTLLSVVGIVAIALITFSYLIEIAQQVFGPELFRTDLPMSLFAGILALSIAAAGFFMLEIGLGVSLRRKSTYEAGFNKSKAFTRKVCAYVLPKIVLLRTRFAEARKR